MADHVRPDEADEADEAAAEDDDRAPGLAGIEADESAPGSTETAADDGARSSAESGADGVEPQLAGLEPDDSQRPHESGQLAEAEPDDLEHPPTEVDDVESQLAGLEPDDLEAELAALEPEGLVAGAPDVGGSDGVPSGELGDQLTAAGPIAVSAPTPGSSPPPPPPPPPPPSEQRQWSEPVPASDDEAPDPEPDTLTPHEVALRRSPPTVATLEAAAAALRHEHDSGELPPPHPSDWSPAPLGAARRSRLRRRLLWVAAAIVLIAGLAAGAVVVLSGDEPPLAFRGQPIDQADQTLATAEESLRGILEQRHGATSDDTRCYFSLADSGSGNVNDYLRCGPVLFVDGDPDAPYLTFPLRVEGDPAEGTAVRLVASAEPENRDPEPLDDGERLRRPDGESPPDGTGGLEPPAPPRAEPGLIAVRDLAGVELTEPAGTAQVVSWSSSYRLLGFAAPERVGQNDDARRPAEGERFVAARIELGEGAAGPNPGTAPQVTIQVDDEDPLPAPAELASAGEPVDVLVSVPTDAERVDLVVTEVGVEQRLSLLTGEPGADNVAVLQRSTRTQQLDARGDLQFVASAPGRVADQFSVSAVVTDVELFWFFGPDGRQHPEGVDRAYLVPQSTFTWDPRLGLGQDVSPHPAAFTLQLPDGTVVPATNLAGGGQVLVAFEVPADFTTGTLVIGGRYTDNEGVTIDFGSTALQAEIEIPLDG